MLYSKLKQEDNLYISLHAEQVYQNFNKFDDNFGFFTAELSRATIERIEKEIKSIPDTKCIILDFYELDDNRNSFVEFSNIVKHCHEKKINISLIRINESLYDKLQIHKIKSTYNLNEFQSKINNIIHFNLCSNENVNIDKFEDHIFYLYSKTLLEEKNLYAEDQEKTKQYSHSSNVTLPKYLNIKKFIEEKEVSFFGLYLLCKKAIKEGLVPNLYVENRPIIVFPQ